MCNINNMKNPALRALLGIKLQQVNNTSYAMKWGIMVFVTTFFSCGLWFRQKNEISNYYLGSYFCVDTWKIQKEVKAETMV